MKSILTITVSLLLLLAGVALAQDNPVGKGNWQLGGGLSIISSSGDLYENADGDGISTIAINPAANYFVANGLAIGGRILYSKVSQGDASFSTFGLGPEVTYYFTLDKSRAGKGVLYPFIGGAFMFSKSTVDDGTDELKTTFTTLALYGGAVYMLSDAVGIFGQLEYDMDTNKLDDAPAGVDDSISGSEIMLFTGFTFFLIK